MIPKMIPKIIHQIYLDFDGTDIKDKPIYVRSQEAIKEVLPEWQYILWKDQDCLRLLQEHLPQYVEFFNNFRYKIQKVDFMKYAIVSVYGGIYLDLDEIVKKPLDDLLQRNLLFYDGESINGGAKWGGGDFFGSSKNHPLWSKFFKEMIKNYKEKESQDIYNVWTGRFVLQTTGPRFLTRFMKKYASNVEPLKIMYFPQMQGNYCDETNCYIEGYMTGSWLEKGTINKNQKTK